MIKVRCYTDNDKEIWNSFNSNAKNHLFMFDRNYMDYHRDRFTDNSLMFYKDEKPVALLPACKSNGKLISHGGLTYGGFIVDNNMKQHTMNDCVDSLIDYAGKQGFAGIIYKRIPHIFCEQSSEEDKYALFSHGAVIKSVDASTYLNLSAPLKMSKGRRAQISRAKREGVEIRVLTERNDYDNFIILENQVLETRHGTTAVHTSEELMMLHNNFPDNIHLFGALYDCKLIAGAVIYEYDQVIHFQYMAADEKARVIGALDLVVYEVINRYKDYKKWIDFGISTEHDRIFLNNGLIAQKEGFGGRTGVYEVFELKIQ